MERTSDPAPERVLVATPASVPLRSMASWSSPAARVLALQRSAGNAAVTRMLQREAAETGRVDSPVGIVYARPDLQSEHVAELPRGAPVPVKGRSGDFWLIDRGYVYFADLAVLADDQAAGATVDTADWRQVIPDAKPRGGAGLGNRAGHSSAQGQLIGYAAGAGNVPTASYSTRGKDEVAEAAPLAPGVTQADVDAAAAAITGARGRGGRRRAAARAGQCHAPPSGHFRRDAGRG
jgi:hypothetical protein